MTIPTLLPLWLREFNEGFYNTLSFQISSAPSILNFTEFLSSLETWRSYPREELLTDWFPQVHAYLAQIMAYEEVPSIDVSAYSIFNLGGLLESVSTNVIRYKSQTLVDYDSKIILSAASKELSTISSRQEEILAYTKPKILAHVLSLTPVKMVSVPKIKVLQKMFIEDNYSNVYNSLNVGSLTIPEGL